MACVADPPAVERLVFAEDGLLGAVRPGFRYLECSTVSPDTTRRVQAALRERGADALEAPVTGSKNGAENGTLLFMTGGDAAVHEELLPVMMAMGTKAIHCGAMGQGSTVKLIGNSVISFMLEALCEGIVLGPQGGHPARDDRRGRSRPRATRRPTTPSRAPRSRSATSRSTSRSTSWSRTRR